MNKFYSICIVLSVFAIIMSHSFWSPAELSFVPSQTSQKKHLWKLKIINNPWNWWFNNAVGDYYFVFTCKHSLRRNTFEQYPFFLLTKRHCIPFQLMLNSSSRCLWCLERKNMCFFCISIYRGFPKNCVFFRNFLPCQHLAANGCTEILPANKSYCTLTLRWELWRSLSVICRRGMG